MTKTIWKTELTPWSGAVMLPKGARPISVHMQDGTPMMWSIVDPAEEGEELRIHIAGTGHDLPDGLGRFIGTFLVQAGTLVFHVFELT